MSSNLTLFVALAVVTQLTQINCSKIYFFGGTDDNYKNTFSATHLNGSNGEWTNIQRLPTMLSLFGGAVDDKKIYLFGGVKGESQFPNRLNDEVSTASYVYDPSADTYTPIRSLPERRYNFGAAAFNGSIYIAGGTVHTFNEQYKVYDYQYQNSVLRYDIQTDQWHNVSSMNHYRYWCPLVELDGLLYAIGGWDSQFSNSIEAYNPITDQWTDVVPKIWTEKYYWFTGAVAYRGKIYLLDFDGGFQSYSPSTNQFTKLSSRTNELTGRGYRMSSLVVMDEQIWSVGGEWLNYTTGRWTMNQHVHTYDLKTDRWTRQKDMNIGRENHAAFVVED